MFKRQIAESLIKKCLQHEILVLKKKKLHGNNEIEIEWWEPDVARGQEGHVGQRCKLFVPVVRQFYKITHNFADDNSVSSSTGVQSRNRKH